MDWQRLKRFWFYFLAFACTNMITTFWIIFCVYLIMFSPDKLSWEIPIFFYRSILNIVYYLIYCTICHYVYCSSCWWQIKTLLKTLDHLDKVHVFKPNNAFILKTHRNIIYECSRIFKKLWRTSTTFMFKDFQKTLEDFDNIHVF